MRPDGSFKAGHDRPTSEPERPAARRSTLGLVHHHTPVASALGAVRAEAFPRPLAPPPLGVLPRLDDAVPLSHSGGPGSRRRMLAAVKRLGVRPGESVLEVGSGSGFSAAVLADLVGSGGHVVTVEVDRHRAADARLNLARAGYARVDVIGGDGTYGFAAAAPYDRIVVWGGTRLLPRQWVEQLSPGGRLVVPLDLQGVQLLASLVREGESLQSCRLEPARFAPLRGGPVVTKTDVLVGSRGWLARAAGLEAADAGPLAAVLGCGPVPQGDVTAVLPAGGWPFMLFLLLRDRRAVVLDRPGGEQAGAWPVAVGLFDPEEGSLAAVMPMGDGSRRLRAFSFGRTDMLAALDHHVRAWIALRDPRPVLRADPRSTRDTAEDPDPRQPCQLTIEWRGA